MTPTTAEYPLIEQAPAASALGRNQTDRRGFQIGWDHARHGLAPAAALLVDGTAIGQGWRAAKAVFGRRHLPTTPALRTWLRLRTDAWCAGLPFDDGSVTPKWLAGITATHCPVTRLPLGGAPGADSAPVFVCLDPGAGYRAGNLVMLSRRAATAIGGDPAAALPPESAARLDVLLSFGQTLPFCEAAGLPLLVLPPPGLQPINPVQALQRLLTLQFATPGWSTRLRALADGLPADARGQPDAALRHDFHLFIGAMAPRLLGAAAAADGCLPQATLEDAWADARVLRRWQRLAAALGETRCAALLVQAARQATRQAGAAASRSTAARAASARVPRLRAAPPRSPDRPPASRPGTGLPPPATASRASGRRPGAAT
jgi:hypothetical protein